MPTLTDPLNVQAVQSSSEHRLRRGWWGGVLVITLIALALSWSAVWFTLFSAEAGNREYLLAAGVQLAAALVLGAGAGAALPSEVRQVVGGGSATTALVLGGVLLLAGVGSLLETTEPAAGLTSSSLLAGVGVSLLAGLPLLYLGGVGALRWLREQRRESE